jgi:hypothetical protein
MDIVTDKEGRKIQLRRVGVLETMRLFKALGSELSENRSYVNLAIIAASVEGIDDVPIPFPLNVAGVEAIISRIGDENINWIANGIKARTSDTVVADAGN